MKLKDLKNIVKSGKATKKQLVEYIRNRYDKNLNKYRKTNVLDYFNFTLLTKSDLGKKLNIRKVKYTTRDKKMVLVDKLFNKSIEKQEKLDKLDKIKKMVDNGFKNEREVTITRNNLNNYSIAIHNMEVIKARNANPNSIYVQTAYFYRINDGKRTEIKRIRISHLMSKVDKKNKKNLTNRFLLNSSWVVMSMLQAVAYEDGEIYNPIDAVVIKTRTYKRVLANKNEYIRLIKAQQFKESVTNTCVYDGLLDYAKNQKHKHMKALYNKLINNKDKYAKMYKYDDLRELSADMKISITIKDLVNGNDVHITSPMARNNVKFINSRYNHLDLYQTSGDITYVSADEYAKQKETADYYVESFSTLYLLDKTIKVEPDEFKKSYNKWVDKYDLKNKKILCNSDMNKFLDTYDFSMFRTVNNIKNKKVNELDVRKAYYNYDKTNYYRGLPSGSFLLFKCDEKFEYSKLEDMVGFFNITITKSNNEFEKLGFHKDQNYTLFTSEIDVLLVMSHKIKFVFNYAMISPRFDAPFDDSMKQKTCEGVSFYSKSVGFMLIDDDKIITKIKSNNINQDFINLISDKNKDTYVNGNYAILKERDDNASTNRHIGYAIHAYVKSLILRKIFDIGVENVLMVRLDSIVYKSDGNNYEDDQFRNKKIDTNISDILGYTYSVDSDLDYGIEPLNNTENDIDYEDDDVKFYNNNTKIIDYVDNIFTPTNEYIYKRLVFLGGKGGSGKTYSALKTSNMETRNICFTTHCWNLISEQKSKYPIHGLSLHKLLGYIGEAKYEKHRINSIRYIVIDEATLIDESTINDIIKDYPHLFIFVIGDIDPDGFYYQCSTQNQVIRNFDKFQYVTYTKTYRFDDELNRKLDDLRTFMKQNPNNIHHLNKYIKKNWADNIKDINTIKYNDNDIGISSLNELNQKNNSGLSNHFIANGAKPKYWIKNTRYERGQLRGQYLGHNIPDHKNYEMTLFKTIHSYQGCQLPDDNTKIIICIDSLFDFNLFFTALSRARNLNQIVMLFGRIDKNT